MDLKNKKTISSLIFILGFGMLLCFLYLGFTESESNLRGFVMISGAFLLSFGLYLYPTKYHKNIINMIFLFPLIFTLLLTVIVPFIFGVFYSFTDWNGLKFTEFLGFKNYKDIFKTIDYIYSFKLTFVYTIINMILVNTVAFGLALLCTSKIKGRNVYRAAFFLPNLIGGIVLGYVWQFIFNKVFILMMPDKMSMLSDPNLAVVAILIVSTWQYAGYIMMIYVTGLQSMPKDVLEASKVDGAGFWTTLIKIKLPMMANTITISMFLTLMNSFKQFDLNFAITGGAPIKEIVGQTVSATGFLALNIYTTAVTRNNFAQGQAKAVIFFIILAVVSLVQVSINKKKEIEL